MVVAVVSTVQGKEGPLHLFLLHVVVQILVNLIIFAYMPCAHGDQTQDAYYTVQMTYNGTKFDSFSVIKYLRIIAIMRFAFCHIQALNQLLHRYLFPR